MKTELIPVIHKLSNDQVFKNVEVCMNNGIKKVFLIDHTGNTPDELLETADFVRIKFGIWTGVNMLGLSTSQCLSMTIPVDGLWCDASISSDEAKSVREFKGLFFGGLAFKYQPQPTDLKAACEDAILATDVATTSGPGTGKPASPSKIQALREYLGSHPLAIASGVNSENILLYKDIANYLLVASSITNEHELIVVNKLKELNDLLDA